jgi:hypothetical protein
MKKDNIKLLRIFFRHNNFTQEEENNLHYIYNQISLLLIVELSKLYLKKIDGITISFGTMELWLKYYKEDNIPNFHWFKKTGSASIIFDYKKFFELEYEDRKKMVLHYACESIYKIAEKGKQLDLMQAINQIIQKYQGINILNTDYITLEQAIKYKDDEISVKVLFEFNEKVKIQLVVNQLLSDEKKYLLDEFSYGYIEWLITAFKKIEVKDNYLYLIGSKELEYLPFKLMLD